MTRSAAPSSRRHKVIAVTADGGLGRALGFLLQAEGYAVEVLRSAETLLAMAPLDADCLVIDQDLPGVSGAETVARLWQRQALPAVLLVGAAGQDGYEAVAGSRIELIEKPFHGAQLLAAVRHALGE